MEMRRMMGIRLDNITKIFNENTRLENKVLKDISLQVEKGEMIAIVGKSGSGKSTLLHILGCLDQVSSGSYKLDGIDIVKASKKVKANIRNEKIGFILQDFGLIADDTVLESVMLPMMFDKSKISAMRGRAFEQLKLIGIEHLASNKIATLSGGEKQRVTIARALVKNPDYILADEPTGALDSENAEIFMEQLKILHQKKKTIIIVTHDMEIARQCERTIKISDGMLIC